MTTEQIEHLVSMYSNETLRALVSRKMKKNAWGFYEKNRDVYFKRYAERELERRDLKVIFS